VEQKDQQTPILAQGEDNKSDSSSASTSSLPYIYIILKNGI